MFLFEIVVFASALSADFVEMLSFDVTHLFDERKTTGGSLSDAQKFAMHGEHSKPPPKKTKQNLGNP